MKKGERLDARIQGAFLDMERAVARAELLAMKAQTTGDDGYWDGVALNLQSFYTGVEQVLESIAHSSGEDLPVGPHWHRDLLFQMTLEIGYIRPAVLSLGTAECLLEYLSFRHAVRNIYAHNLRSSRLQELSRHLRPCFEQVKVDLKQFSSFLLKLDEGSEE